MEKIVLGRTGLVVTRTAFGALPIQRRTMEEAVPILRKAYDSGILLFDTARAYTDSEAKIGQALSSVRQNIVITTKCMVDSGAKIPAMLETSLRNLRTDYVDVLQFHFAPFMPKPGDGSGILEALQTARQQGKARFIGLTSHALPVALEAARSGFYDTVQYPLSLLSSDKDLELIAVCAQNNVGLLAMKALGGGLVRNIPAAFAFMRRFPNLVPLWGIEKMKELEEFLALEANPPQWGPEIEAAVAKERAELQGNFCRGCGYCLPCPADIDIPTVARSGLSSRRMPAQIFASQEWQNKVKQAEECLDCQQCAARCPYELRTYELIKEQAQIYWRTLREMGLASA
jgi:aryl-alcohol dehydrogenase-like predicted oxidoreductase